jgi:NhaP-type Na+/H+ or K+/H+ antiporter
MTRRLALTSAVFAGAAAVLLAALAAAERGDSEGAATKPRLSVDLTPLVVAGSGFQAGETVRVTVRGVAVPSRSDKASAAGRISVRFPGVSLEQCPKFLVITATGDKGSRAQLRRMPAACGLDPGRAP